MLTVSMVRYIYDNLGELMFLKTRTVGHTICHILELYTIPVDVCSDKGVLVRYG